MLTLTFAQKPLSFVATGVTRVAARGFVGVTVARREP